MIHGSVHANGQRVMVNSSGEWMSIVNECCWCLGLSHIFSLWLLVPETSWTCTRIMGAAPSYWVSCLVTSYVVGQQDRGQNTSRLWRKGCSSRKSIVFQYALQGTNFGGQRILEKWQSYNKLQCPPNRNLDPFPWTLATSMSSPVSWFETAMQQISNECPSVLAYFSL